MSTANRGFHRVLEKDHPYIFIDTCVQVWPDANLADAHRHGVTAYGVTFEGLGAYCSVERALEEFMYWHLVARKYPNICIVYEAEDIRRAKKEGKAALLLATQEGSWIGDKLHPLEAFYRLGLRMFLPAYNAGNMICGGALDRIDGGLTLFGELVVDECNRIGMLLDCSHISRQASLDIARRSRQPVVFSHSNAKAVADNPRNIDDEQIKACAATGGVVGVAPWGPLVLKTGATELPTLDDLIDHIDHIAQLLGSTDNIGIGTDFSLGTYPPHPPDPWGAPDYFKDVLKHFNQLAAGSPSPVKAVKGFNDYSEVVNLIERLPQRGYSDQDVQKILGENYLRVFAEVWK